MKGVRMAIFAMAAVAMTGGAALADPAKDCEAGIQTIKAAIAANPAADKLEKLNKLLKDAEREQVERPNTTNARSGRGRQGNRRRLKPLTPPGIIAMTRRSAGGAGAAHLI